MTTPTVRAGHGLCANCGKRCAAWVCQDCSFNSVFFEMPRREAPRLSPTAISRMAQRSTDQGTAHDHYLAMQSFGQRWVEVTERGEIVHAGPRDPRIARNQFEGFTAEERRRWDANLRKAPTFATFQISEKRRLALERRKWERFCGVWGKIGLAMWTATFVPKKKRKKRREQSSFRLLDPIPVEV